MIEVKSDLDRAQLSEAIEKCQRMKSLTKTAMNPQTGSVVHVMTRGGREYNYFPTLIHVFAYRSIDLTTLSVNL